MQVAFFILLFVLGAVFGSFLCCQVRRLKEKGKKVKSKYSICFNCHKRLKWYDNIPIISWLVLRGKCRNCGKKIGVAELLSEILTAVAFLALSTTINVETATALEWAEFILVVIFAMMLVFLAIYDGLYGELPTFALTFSIICAIIIVILRVGDSFLVVREALLAAGLYGGIYLILYLISRGKWVGDGDWLLALGIGLTLGSPWLAVISLFLANFSACVVMLPLMNRRKSRKNHQIYFGPFMVFAFVVTYVFADFFISMI